METKVCCECGRELPIDQFNWRNKAKGIRQDRCRECFSEYNRRHYQAKKEKIKADVRKYRAENPEKVFETRVKMCEKNPNRRNAYHAVDEGIRCGKIKKPERCQICGQIPDKRIEAHHEDYTKPLDIIWCCSKCHDKLDIERRKRLGVPYHSRIRKVRCVETGEVFDSIANAARKYGICDSQISEILRGTRSKSAHGLHWEAV